MYKKIILLSFILLCCFKFIACGKNISLAEISYTEPTGTNAPSKENKLNIEFDDYYFKYNGYIDLVAMFDEKYDNKDYDGDGLYDRIYRKVFKIYKDNKYNGMKTNYRIDFGNGDKLDIGDFDDIYTGIQIIGHDLTGDGINEIIFCGKHEVSTLPAGGSEIAVYQKRDNKYEMMSLPRLDEWTGIDKFEVGYSFYKLNMEDDEVTIFSPVTNFVETITVSDNNVINFFKKVNKNESISSPAWRVSIEELNGAPILVLYNHIGNKYNDKNVATYLTWQKDKFKPVKMEVLTEYQGN